jgi:HAT1-interacting factor 1
VAPAADPDRAALLAAAAGTLVELPGESAADRQARIQKAASGAKDISGLVKSRKNQKPAPAAGGSAANGKRKLEDEDDATSEKKVRFGA